MTQNFMQEALLEARKAAERDEVPIGAVVVLNGEIIARASNRTEELNDPTAHAEMLVIREACQKLGSARIGECDLYVTLEPCPMCATAISFARIRRLYYGAVDIKGGGTYTYAEKTCHHKPEIYDGINSSEAVVLLKDFFLQKR